MNFRFLGALICLAGLSACRTTQVPAFFPAAQQYQPHVVPLSAQTEVLEYTPTPDSKRMVIGKTRVKTTPRKLITAPVDTSRAVTKKSKGAQPTLVITGTDTLVGYPVNTRLVPVSTSGPPVDPTTSAINIVGGGVTAFGVGFLLAGLTAEAPKTEWGGVRNIVAAFYGLLLLGIGIPLLLFQGKNGRLRRLRESRKAAAISPDPANPATTPPVQDQKPEKLSARGVAGLTLIIIGALCALSLIFAGIWIVLMLPLGLLCLATGLVLYLTAEAAY